MITRNFYISLLVFNVILFGGGLLLRHSEAGVQAVVVVAFTVGLTMSKYSTAEIAADTAGDSAVRVLDLPGSASIRPHPPGGLR